MELQRQAMGNVRWSCVQQPWSRCIELRLGIDHGDGNISIAKNITFGVRKDSEVAEIIDPVLQFSEISAQQLMDELWKIGVRPKDGTGSVGQIGAMEANLSDLRDVTKALLKKVTQ